jgi:hypothetical protein
MLGLGAFATLRCGRCLLPRRRGVFRPRRMFGFVAFSAFLLGFYRFSLLRMHEHRRDGQQAAEDGVSGNCSGYIHEILPY